MNKLAVVGGLIAFFWLIRKTSGTASFGTQGSLFSPEEDRKQFRRYLEGLSDAELMDKWPRYRRLERHRAINRIMADYDYSHRKR